MCQNEDEITIVYERPSKADRYSLFTDLNFRRHFTYASA